MPSGTQRKRIRKSPSDRRAAIVDTAAATALTEGLECVTLCRVGERLDVRPGLISHCFPVVEQLVAEAFGTAAGGELDALLPPDRAERPPTERLARFFALATGPAFDDLSRLRICPAPQSLSPGAARTGRPAGGRVARTPGGADR
ncbi:hypothetical protein [Streptomyces sp. NPDC014734]|uniref:hypothetical protein n=1 Tax=Streptomyces sp. NPDC014734 TaxID=3364886 RepID=UPI0037003A5C